MNPKAKRLINARALVSMELRSRIRQLVSIDGQLDRLELNEEDDRIVREIRETQDTANAAAIVPIPA